MIPLSASTRVEYKENDEMNRNRMKIGRILTVGLMAASTALIALAASGCVMETETDVEYLNEDSDALSMDETVTDTDSEVALDALPAECEEDDNCVVIEELVITGDLTEPVLDAVALECEDRDDCVILEVRADHFGATLKILDKDLTVVAEMNARDCPVPESSYHHTCRVLLLPGPHIVEFGHVRLYERPENALIF